MPKDALVNASAPVSAVGSWSRVSEMQAKLHRWAAADHGRRFDDLFNLVHVELGYVLTRLNQVMHSWANYFKHAVAKGVFCMLENFAWRRVIRMLQTRHHWNWTDVRRRFTTPSGQWRPITAGEIALRPVSAIPVTRYRYRGNTIPSPWPLDHA